MASNDDDAAATASAPPQQQQQQQQQQPETLLYFAFGSNLSSTQMAARCPGAAAVGLAFLPGYDFIINERGFANVVLTAAAATTPATRDGYRVGGVYGVLYRLASPAEKRRLDRYEGVPRAYEDLVLDVEQLSGGGSSSSSSDKPATVTVTTVRALVYVDRQRVSPAAPRAEYVTRMNAGIREAGAGWGLPGGYVRDVMRRYIPPDDAGDDATGDDAAGGQDETAGRLR